MCCYSPVKLSFFFSFSLLHCCCRIQSRRSFVGGLHGWKLLTKMICFVGIWLDQAEEGGEAERWFLCRGRSQAYVRDSHSWVKYSLRLPAKDVISKVFSMLEHNQDFFKDVSSKVLTMCPHNHNCHYNWKLKVLFCLPLSWSKSQCTTVDQHLGFSGRILCIFFPQYVTDF